MQPYFSLILPVYNVAQYLDECVQSILRQDFKDYEVILVDDGSTDESSAMCDEYQAAHADIRVLHKANGGLSSARNAGLELARGKYIWWIDSDDYIEDGALSCLHEACEKNRPDIVKMNYSCVSDMKVRRISNLAPGLYNQAEVRSAVLEKAMCTAGRFTLSAWSHVYRRAFLIEHKLLFVSERIVGSEDYLFNLCALLRAESVAALEQSLYVYRRREQSLSNCYRRNLPEQYHVLYQQLRAYYQDAGLLGEYEKHLCYFYVWHLLRGTCLLNEYVADTQSDMKKRRERVQAFLRNPDAKEAAKRCRDMPGGIRKRVMMWAMSCAHEPTIYWICCIWPKVKRRLSGSAA